MPSVLDEERDGSSTHPTPRVDPSTLVAPSHAPKTPAPPAQPPVATVVYVEPLHDSATPVGAPPVPPPAGGMGHSSQATAPPPPSHPLQRLNTVARLMLGQSAPQQLLVTCPPWADEGQTMEVAGPDRVRVLVTVPYGVHPGMDFLVEVPRR